MKKLFLILSLGSGLLIPGLTLANTNQNGLVLFCPGTSQIVVGDIYSGKAHSKDRMWEGISAIPPQYKNNWRTKIDAVNYNSDGYCQYYMEGGGLEAIDLQDQHFPAGYELYDMAGFGVPLSNCWDNGNYQQTPTKPTKNSENYACYYYKKPLS